ncbi:HpcH/HpaI aldolase/citrate lyase family protein [Streptomyces hokutonensis]|uniref:HpcH/HpaI aldolase/citrate lyase family protein n=1 Tax=Streptomyces hokutonensis TaxID=1306990 RepID=UPI00382F7624
MTHTPLRTILAVPASSERFLAKARTSTASAVMVDLEDGVAEHDKHQSRLLVGRWAERLATPQRQLWLRINGTGSPHLAADLAVLHDVVDSVDALVLPKATTDGVAEVSGRTDLPLVALIETADGVENAWHIAQHPAVRALMFGELDYRAQLAVGGGLHADDTSWAQARIVNAAAGATVPSIAGPTVSVDDEQLLASHCARQAGLGFTGKLCIHPAQLATVQTAFGPDTAMVAHARRILGAVGDGQGPGAITVDGDMVDQPVIARARQILAEASQ